MKNSFGIHRGEYFDLKLIIKYPMSQRVREKVWVDNQRITELQDNSIIFEASMIGKTKIQSWILSMGSNVEIAEPKELGEVGKYNVELILALENKIKSQLLPERLLSPQQALDILLQKENLKVRIFFDINKNEAVDIFGEKFYSFSLAYYFEFEGDSVYIVSQSTGKVYRWDVLGNIKFLRGNT